MTDFQALQDAIKRSGLKRTFIAQQLGISYQAFLNKERGLSQFNQSEIMKLWTMLNLSNDDVHKIFFNCDVGEKETV